jgi:hypothetical protein
MEYLLEHGIFARAALAQRILYNVAQLAESNACNILIFSPIEQGQRSMAQASKRAQASRPTIALPLYPGN